MSSSSLLDKIANVLMPEEDVEEPVESVKEEPKEPIKPQTTEKPERPFLTVHTNKVPELKILVFEPTTFDQANIIADHLKAKEAVIVNYSYVDRAEQQRLCDFVNGVCYVMEGAVQRISDYNVLYVPANVDISKELYAYSIPTYAKRG